MNEESNHSPAPEKTWLERLSSAFNSGPKNNIELLNILREANQNELVNNEVLSIMEGALGVSEAEVEDIMIPRPQMIVIQSEQKPEDMLKTIINSGHSRFPVIGESVDDIKGILLAKSLLPLILEGTDNFDINKLMLPANIIPESKKVNELLKEFRENRYHMAIVVDEYGGISGLITIEDILEEIVGEIEDETDLEEDDKFIRKLNNHDFLIKALTPIEDFNHFFDSQLDDEEYDTIGGLLMKEFGHLPRRNESAQLEQFHFTVINADNRKIHLLKMLAPPEINNPSTEWISARNKAR